MLWYIIGGVLFFGGVGTLVYVYLRHHKQLGQIRLEEMPAHRQVDKKHALIDERLERKLRNMRVQITTRLNPHKEKIKVHLSGYLDRLQKLERHYHKQRLVSKSVNTDVGERVEQQAFIHQMLEECEKLLEAEDFASVEKKCIEVITIDPRLYRAYILLGSAYRGQKDLANANQSFQHAVRLLEKMQSRQPLLELEKSALTDACYQAGETLQESGEYQRALVFFVKAAKLEPNNPRHLDQVITTALAARDRYTATVYLDNFRKINPENQKIDDWQRELRGLEKN